MIGFTRSTLSRAFGLSSGMFLNSLPAVATERRTPIRRVRGNNRRCSPTSTTHQSVAGFSQAGFLSGPKSGKQFRTRRIGVRRSSRMAPAESCLRIEMDGQLRRCGERPHQCRRWRPDRLEACPTPLCPGAASEFVFFPLPFRRGEGNRSVKSRFYSTQNSGEPGLFLQRLQRPQNFQRLGRLVMPL